MSGAPEGIPASVAVELQSAFARAGHNDESLRRASERLPMLFAMTPAEFEQYSADIYNRIV